MGQSTEIPQDNCSELRADSADSPVCEILCIHSDLIDSVRKKLIPSEQVHPLAELFKTLGDPTRVRIMDALAKNEFCVCDLAELLGLSQSATSHQLRVLRNNRLVKYRREGKMVYYSLDDNHVLALYREGLEHILEGRV
ncbi:helix-turn-helix transcriptional regulator [Desulfosporosinus sp. BICA1-9]|uniref:ArsR/SmtB family transcription factor n=1 Tax=Desulfosporosinus sp. BICA1-9 TaxID=1531958 RepID=UPI000B1C89CC|nr:metalloregulator ArsR/SmtB family transcription factor [Desulfosporosinus sp. BICA1-9]KJS85359.1 MAG: transcriptional repressor SmtB [Desulfosporosinus sp. BICA1-9]HBW37205.1 transcriptional repressor SmtB [Desulfosporosinus sp.]